MSSVILEGAFQSLDNNLDDVIRVISAWALDRKPALKNWGCAAWKKWAFWRQAGSNCVMRNVGSALLLELKVKISQSVLHRF